MKPNRELVAQEVEDAMTELCAVALAIAEAPSTRHAGHLLGKLCDARTRYRAAEKLMKEAAST